MTDWIDLHDLRTTCIVGILPDERVNPQPLEARISVAVDLGAAGDDGDLSKSLDYATLCEQFLFLAQEGRFYLLESLAVATCRLWLAKPADPEDRPRPERVRISLRKPEILSGRAVPGITMERDTAWYEQRTRALHDGVRGDILVEVPHTAAFRVRLSPGARWAPRGDFAVHVIAGHPRMGEVIEAGSRPAVLLAVQRT